MAERTGTRDPSKDRSRRGGGRRGGVRSEKRPKDADATEVCYRATDHKLSNLHSIALRVTQNVTFTIV